MKIEPRHITFEFGFTTHGNLKNLPYCTMFIDQEEIGTELGKNKDLQSKMLAEWLNKIYGLNLAISYDSFYQLQDRIKQEGFSLKNIKMTRKESVYLFEPL